MRYFTHLSTLLRFWPVLSLGVLAACATLSETVPLYHVVLRVDDVERAYALSEPATVGDLLNLAQLTLGEEDHLSHPQEEPLVDGLVVVLKRKSERTECVLTPISFGEKRLPNELLAPGETRAGPRGKMGSERVCNYIEIRKGETSQREISRELVSLPIDQITYFGPDWQTPPMDINGTIAYLSHGSVWIMRENSAERRPISRAMDGDSDVFQLSANGEHLLYSRKTSAEHHQLWLLRSTSNWQQPALLLEAQDPMAAIWHPQEPATIYFARKGDDPALIKRKIELTNGRVLEEEIAHPRLAAQPQSRFLFNDKGNQMAYAQPGELGIFDTVTQSAQPLARFTPQLTKDGDWWLPPLAWTKDGLFLLTVLPTPINAQPNRFDIVIFAVDGRFRATLFEDVGMMAEVQPSPNTSAVIAFTRQYPEHQAIHLADRDGSNERRLFPLENRSGIQTLSTLTWGPNGQELLVIADGNLWLIAADSGAAKRLSGDGGVQALNWRP